MKKMDFYQCPVEATVSAIGGKWNILIIYHLLKGTRRFGELKKAIPGITQKMLTQTLRELEENHVISRMVYPVVPPKVEYSLTDLGGKLEQVFDMLCAWGQEYIDASDSKASVEMTPPREFLITGSSSKTPAEG